MKPTWHMSQCIEILEQIEILEFSASILEQSTVDGNQSAGWELPVFIFSPWSIDSADVYRHESGRCCTLLFFLTYLLSFHLSRFSFYISTLAIDMSAVEPSHFHKKTAYLINVRNIARKEDSEYKITNIGHT